MAKATINTGATGQPVHTRTSSDLAESQVVVIGTDGSDAVLDPATLAKEATLAAVAKEATLAAVLAAVDGLETTLSSVLTAVDGLEGQVATETTLASLLAATDGLEGLLGRGAYAYAAGTAAGTVDVPAGGRVRRVAVMASSTAATVTIAGGATITVPANTTFDETVPGDAAAGGDVVIGGGVATYYVAWTV